MTAAFPKKGRSVCTKTWPRMSLSFQKSVVYILQVNLSVRLQTDPDFRQVDIGGRLQSDADLRQVDVGVYLETDADFYILKILMKVFVRFKLDDNLQMFA